MKRAFSQNFLIILFTFCLGLGGKFTSSTYGESLVDDLLNAPQEDNLVLVERVIRADTIILESGQRIRLIGLNAPEPPERKTIQRDEFGFEIEVLDPTFTLEEQALSFAKALLDKKYIRIEFDQQNKDSDQTTLAYAFLPDGTFINAEILRQGFADLKIRPPNTKYAQQLRAAYQEAHREKRGLQSE